jgi:hypothetical protein
MWHALLHGILCVSGAASNASALPGSSINCGNCLSCTFWFWKYLVVLEQATWQKLYSLYAWFWKLLCSGVFHLQRSIFPMSCSFHSTFGIGCLDFQFQKLYSLYAWVLCWKEMLVVHNFWRSGRQAHCIALHCIASYASLLFYCISCWIMCRHLCF